jgi:hypothetical protein
VIADEVDDPWYAAQSYAWCARFAPASEAGRLVARAFDRARDGKDAYQRLAACAWPLRALIEVDRADEAGQRLDAIAGLAPSVVPPSSRAEACFVVFQAVVTGPRELGTRAFRWLLASVAPNGHWRERRAIRDAALIMGTLGLLAPADLETLPIESSVSHSINERFARGTRRQPRAFFWPAPVMR